ncbi:MAG TPA: hypothetical protein VNW90_20160 [Acetobacteraceae bacterium]|jgi:hypothetical protein|nr:hypothetical protein [Acetobacteraceae bacterium]
MSPLLTPIALRHPASIHFSSRLDNNPREVSRDDILARYRAAF